jgi:hypothetical protein
MIILTEVTDKIQVVLGGAITANQLQCAAFWRDVTTTTYVPGRTLVNTNNTTDVDVVGSPGSSTQRIVDFLSVYNRDTVNATVTVKLDANGTEYILWKGILATGEMLQYNDKNGFTTTTIAGAIKQSQMWGTNNATVNAINTTVLATDVINNNAVANTIAGVTGLSFPVVAGKMYWFEFNIFYTAQATTTGSRWSVSGPGSPTALCYTSEYSLAATTTTRNANNLSYDLPAASNATSSSTGSNQAIIYGFIIPSANGTLIARFASEVLSSAITAKIGSMVRWQQVT